MSEALQNVTPEEALDTVEPDRYSSHRQRRVSVRMNNFLRAYNDQCGNISAACVRAGISRRSVYRWLEGELPIYKQFQHRLRKLKPDEKLIDAAEQTIMAAINKGDLTAAIFTLKSKGKHRGWSERPDVPANPPTATGSGTLSTIADLRAMIEKRANEKRITFADELNNFLHYFGHKIPPAMRDELIAAKNDFR